MLVHKPGVSNRADHLSQRPDYDEGKGDNEDVQVLPNKLFVNAVMSLDVEQAVYDQQEAAMVQIQGWAKDHGLVSVNHHWFKGSKPVVANNLSLQQSILYMYHVSRFFCLLYDMTGTGLLLTDTYHISLMWYYDEA
jgi:hypothetical protein